MDEPLSNLDAKLRTAMRSEISKLHHKLQTTFIYVTHDQVEAMTMGTRIVVMKDGFVQQIDSPRNLYRFPTNKFVAGFIGTPQMNFFAGKLVQRGDKVTVSLDNTGVELDAPLSYFNKANRTYLDGSKPVIIGLRAEHISTNPKLFAYKAKCRVSHVEELGTDCQVYADFNLESEDIVGESPTRVIVKAPAGSFYDVDQVIEVSLDLSQIHVFDATTENTIAPRIPNEVVTEGTVKAGVLSILGSEIALPEAIHVENGKYNVTIPTSAVSLNGSIEADVVEQEDVNGQLLVHLSAGNQVLFALLNGEEQVGKKVKIAIDLKQIALEKDGTSVVAPLALTNSLGGGIDKFKCMVEKEVKGKMKKVSDLEFKLNVAGASFDCPRALALRLVNGGGQNVFSKELEFQFTPYQATIGAEGVAAKVEKVLNYGAETFAVCRVGKQVVNVLVENGFDGKEVRLALEPEQLAIIEVGRGIRLA